MTYLYHLTWDIRVPSILKKGLIPNYRPNKWSMPRALKRSKGRTFLCKHSRRGYWSSVFGGGWAGRVKNATLVWLKVNVKGLRLRKDKGTLEGDFSITKVIPPERIKLDARRS